ncbi:hypothetical protein [Sandaracinus amylolyticus]|uniref:hypothetical protein n=1 Tax=Sandaracinus amylolyticus TaxID=927083 RepID=UPI001F2AD527|nr:hypothetical protein [Sandaracinus amylolyticus]UJR85583.1 Hypothetical protein I5071_76630 [Sandaracinus amylolyticus]
MPSTKRAAWLAIAIAITSTACDEPGRPSITLPDGAAPPLPEVPWLDAGSDAGCGVCVATSPCEDARCEGAECVRTVRDDGAICVEDGTEICVEGACVARGCGDGWREPGPEPVREECDDANAIDGDFCSSACLPTVAPLIDGAAPDEGDLAIAIDAVGRVLVVVVERGEDAALLRAHRFDRRLRASGEPLELARTEARDALVTPVASGLDAGWAIAWVDPVRGVVVGTLAHDASAAPAFVSVDERSASSRTEPAIATRGDGLVVAWSETAGAIEDPLGGVRARLFDVHGRPAGASFLVGSDTSGAEHAPSVAARGDGWAIAWAREDGTPEGHDVRARLFAGRAPIGDELRIASRAEEAEWSPSIGALETGGFALAWSRRGDEGGIEIGLARIAESGAADEPTSLRDDALPLTSPHVVPLASSAFAVLHRGGIARPVTRLATVGEVPGIAVMGDALGAAVPGRIAVASNDDVLIAAWVSAAGDALHALEVVP